MMGTLRSQSPAEAQETDLAAVGSDGTDRTGFVQLAAPFRTELMAHCYRMLGSVHDAEDLVQETYLRAWRGYQDFEGRSSLRFWLYRIATTACLTALEHRKRRFVPSGLGAPGADPDAPLKPPGADISWVQPLPDSSPSRSIAHDPAVIVAERGSVRLAMIAAFQQLPPRQRAVLILRDVLAWRAAEVAELLDTSVASVNSALQRARVQLEQMAHDEDDIIDSLDAGHRALLDQYVRAFENADIVALLGLLRDEVRLEMPPQSTWFTGRADVGRFIERQIFSDPGVMRLLPTTANGGQPTMATYWRGADGTFQPEALQVLGLREHRVVSITAFRDTSLFRSFGLPTQLPADTPLSTSPWSSWL